MGVENLYVEKSVVLPPLPQNPCALMSSLASSCLFAVHIARASQLTLQNAFRYIWMRHRKIINQLFLYLAVLELSYKLK